MKNVYLALIMLVPGVVTLAQTIAPPPIKMGLWQATNTSTMSGFSLPPEMVAKLQAMGRPVPGAEPRTIITQSCVTPEKWQKMISDMQQQRNQECKLVNLHQSPSGMTADVDCKTTDGSSSSAGHVEVNYVSEEKITGKTHMTVTAASQPKPIVIDVNFESVYQGADCKGISPDSAKVVH